MELHPVTLLLGLVSTLLLIAIVATGLSCSIYLIGGEEYRHLQWLYEVAKFKRIC